MEYKKYKCAYCNYEMASKSNKPKCYNCGSRKMNGISEFSSTKPFKIENEVQSMAKNSEKVEKIEEKAEVKKASEIDDFDADILGDDEDEESEDEE